MTSNCSTFLPSKEAYRALPPLLEGGKGRAWGFPENSRYACALRLDTDPSGTAPIPGPSQVDPRASWSPLQTLGCLLTLLNQKSGLQIHVYLGNKHLQGCGTIVLSAWLRPCRQFPGLGLFFPAGNSALSGLCRKSVLLPVSQSLPLQGPALAPPPGSLPSMLLQCSEDP